MTEHSTQGWAVRLQLAVVSKPTSRLLSRRVASYQPSQQSSRYRPNPPVRHVLTQWRPTSYKTDPMSYLCRKETIILFTFSANSIPCLYTYYSFIGKRFSYHRRDHAISLLILHQTVSQLSADSIPLVQKRRATVDKQALILLRDLGGYFQRESVNLSIKWRQFP
jgi:hypothetical protein